MSENKVIIRIKIGTGSLQAVEVSNIPNIGDRVMLPFPTGGEYTAIINDYLPDIDIFLAYWN